MYASLSSPPFYFVTRLCPYFPASNVRPFFLPQRSIMAGALPLLSSFVLLRGSIHTHIHPSLSFSFVAWKVHVLQCLISFPYFFRFPLSSDCRYTYRHSRDWISLIFEMPLQINGTTASKRRFSSSCFNLESHANFYFRIAHSITCFSITLD